MRLIKEGIARSTLNLWRNFRKPEVVMASRATDRSIMMRPEVRRWVPTIKSVSGLHDIVTKYQS